MKRLVLCLLASVALHSASAEVILVPIVASGTPGAYGSSWRSTAYAFNTSRQTVELYAPTDCRFECSPEVGVLPGGFTWLPLKALPESDGMILRVTAGSAESLHFGSRLMDVNREQLDAGTTIPIVSRSDFFSVHQSFYLLGIVLDGDSRVHLRIYEAGKDGAAAVRVRIFQLDELEILREQVIILDPNEDLEFAPQFAELTALEALRDQVKPVPIIGIEITPMTEGRYWGFVSQTNNSTQHVTGFYPD